MTNTLLHEFGPDLWTAEGPIVSFFGFAYPTRMALIRLSGGGLFIWSPTTLSPALKREVDELTRWERCAFWFLPIGCTICSSPNGNPPTRRRGCTPSSLSNARSLRFFGRPAGAPQSGFSMLIRRIKTRSSVSICGRPPRERDFQRQ